MVAIWIYNCVWGDIKECYHDKNMRAENKTIDDLYILTKSDSGNEIVKIGRSKEPLKRAKTLQRSQPFTTQILMSFPGRGYLEAEVHSTLNEFRVPLAAGQEWFNIDPAMAVCTILALEKRRNLQSPTEDNSVREDQLKINFPFAPSHLMGMPFVDFLPDEFIEHPDDETYRKLVFSVKCIREAPHGANSFITFLRKKQVHLKLLKGKHAGKTFRKVKEIDPSYCEWMKNNDVGIIYSLFSDYLNRCS